MEILEDALKAAPGDQLFECQMSHDLLNALPNNSKPIKIGPNLYPSSFVELYRPTGKYISRILIALFNTFSKKGVIQAIGNPCAPGLFFPKLQSGIGIRQFENLEKTCPIISANILNSEHFPDAVTVRAEPFMVLTLDMQWNHFDDYLNAFSSKYRVRAKKIFNDTQNVEIRELHLQSHPDWLQECGKLLSESLQDKTIAIGRDLPRLLDCYQKSLGEHFKVLGMFQDQKLIGFISYIVDGEKLFAMHLGLQKQHPLHAQLYQRMLFQLVFDAIPLGIKRINFGRTGAEIKSTLGASPLENSFVVFTKSKFLLILFKIYARYFQKQYHYTYRSPFKTPKNE